MYSVISLDSNEDIIEDLIEIKNIIEEDVNKEGRGEKENDVHPSYPNNMIKYSWPVQLWMSQQRTLQSREQITSINLPEIPTKVMEHVIDFRSRVAERTINTITSAHREVSTSVPFYVSGSRGVTPGA